MFVMGSVVSRVEESPMGDGEGGMGVGLGGAQGSVGVFSRSN